MNNLFHEDKRILWVLMSLLLILLIVLYVIFLKPMREEAEHVEASSQTLKLDIEQLQGELETKKDDEVFVYEEHEQEKKLPKTKLLDQLLLTLEEIEAVSSSQIIKVDFSYDGDFPETGMDETGEESDSAHQSDDANENDEENDAEDKKVKPAIDISDKPEALQPIILELEVASPNYKSFKQFLTEVEKQERITVVSTLEFEKPGEEELIKAETPSKIMTFKVQLMTFYLDR